MSFNARKIWKGVLGTIIKRLKLLEGKSLKGCFGNDNKEIDIIGGLCCRVQWHGRPMYMWSFVFLLLYLCFLIY